MIDDVLRNLADELTPASGLVGGRGSLRLRQGTIVSVQPDGTVTVTIGGDSTELPGVRCARHVLPIAGLSCWLLSDGRDAFVIAILGAHAGPFAMATGVLATAGTVASGAGVSRTITFPVGRFTQAPVLTVTPFTSSRLSCAVTAISAASATVRMDNWSPSTAADSGLHWHAIQMLSSSGSG